MWPTEFHGLNSINQTFSEWQKSSFQGVARWENTARADKQGIAVVSVKQEVECKK